MKQLNVWQKKNWKQWKDFTNEDVFHELDLGGLNLDKILNGKISWKDSVCRQNIQWM